MWSQMVLQGCWSLELTCLIRLLVSGAGWSLELVNVCGAALCCVSDVFLVVPLCLVFVGEGLLCCSVVLWGCCSGARWSVELVGRWC